MKRSQDSFSYHKALEGLKDDKEKFRPTEDDIHEWFDILNHTLFGDKLHPFVSISIGKPRHAYALFRWFPGERDKGASLTVTQVFKSKKMFVEILAHEMVHLFQYQFKEPLGHGPSFWVWRDNFYLQGLTLLKEYHR